jgi:F0F1-type ATP synthase epsilon subunit
MNQTLEVIVRSRNGIEMEDMADSISSENVAGVFDILPGHTNFITVVNNKIIIRLHNKQVKEYSIQSGVISVEGTKVSIFLGLK